MIGNHKGHEGHKERLRWGRAVRARKAYARPGGL